MLSVSWTRCTIRWLVSVSAPRMQIRHRGGVACVGAGSVRFRTRAPGRSGRGDIAAQPVPASTRRLLDATLLVDASREYVVHGRQVPSSWVWRKLTRRPA